MMIVAGTIDVAPERRADYLAQRTGAIIRSRAEKGCVEYSFASDSLDPGRVRLFEIWESRADLEAHQQTMRADPPREEEIPVLERNVVYYEIASSEPSRFAPSSR
jgi:quinol monooxygenase YgiN